MNKKISAGLSGALLGTALAFGTIAVARVQPPGEPAQSANSMTAFWEKFRAAVIKGDKGTVAALSRFPISRGYGMRSLKNKAQLLRRYRDVFFNETNAAQFFPKAKPFVEKVRPGEFSISCPFASGGGTEEPFVYTFTLNRDGWRFTSFENINE